ncbi:MAG: hypothetical protein ACPHBL_10195 [Spongiibacter marinus]|uniref:hypothetical protein n=1 Tax=Spongiibacter marinus TaxID=354246 RepID=UPI003C5259AC
MSAHYSELAGIFGEFTMAVTKRSGILSILLLAVIAGVVLAVVQAYSIAPDAEALAEESEIFNADDAQWFGEEPETRRVVVGLAVQHAQGGEQALVAVDGQERFVRSGDTLAAPCLRVAEILDASLLLDSCGAYQLLPIGGSGFHYKPLAIGRPQPAARVETVDLRGNNAVTTLVAEYLERLYTSPLSLRGAVKVERKKSDSGEREYYLYPGKDERLFSQLPLRSGDRLHAVNGIALSDSEALSDLYERLDEVEAITITLAQNQQSTKIVLVSLPATVQAMIRLAAE